MQKYSVKIANAIKDFLEDDGLNFYFDKNKGLFKFVLPTEGRIKKLNYLIRVNDDDYTVYAIMPISADHANHEMMAKMAEFVCRVNCGYLNGNFELDFRNGGIRYKTYVDCSGETIPTARIVRGSIYCPAFMFEKYSLGIAKIIFGEISAKEAVAECGGVTLDELKEGFEEMIAESDDEITISMMERLIAIVDGTDEETDTIF